MVNDFWLSILKKSSYQLGWNHQKSAAKYSVTFGDKLSIYKIGGTRCGRLYPRRDHARMHLKTRFDWSSCYSQCSVFADKRVVGVNGRKVAVSHHDLALRRCPFCKDTNPLNIASLVALCASFELPIAHSTPRGQCSPEGNTRSFHVGVRRTNSEHLWVR